MGTPGGLFGTRNPMPNRKNVSAAETANTPRLQTNLDTNFIKLIAIISMVIDHIGTAFFHNIPLFDGLDGLPFPFLLLPDGGAATPPTCWPFSWSSFSSKRKEFCPMLSAIQNRRSIRRFLDKPVPRAAVDAVLLAGSLAPSSKNRQPWRFVVVSGKDKTSLLAAMDRGLGRERTAPLLPGSAGFLGGAENTRRIMAEAPVVILTVNPLGLPPDRPLTPEERIFELCNAQSVGAAMENMSLAAQEAGLGSLWICDTYFAYRELMDWLDSPGELLCALALGYPGESPAPRPRRELSQLVEWRTGEQPSSLPGASKGYL